MLGSLTAASQEHSLQPAQHHGKLRGLHNIVTPSLTLETEAWLVVVVVVVMFRGGDTSMAGMAIAIPGVLHISKTGYTIGKIR